MKYWLLFICGWSSLSIANAEVDLHSYHSEESLEISDNEIGCSSIVCNKVIESKSVNSADDFPERNMNETLAGLSNVIFFAGEIGLAENVQEEEPELSPVR